MTAPEVDRRSLERRLRDEQIAAEALSTSGFVARRDPLADGGPPRRVSPAPDGCGWDRGERIGSSSRYRSQAAGTLATSLSSRLKAP